MAFQYGEYGQKPRRPKAPPQQDPFLQFLGDSAPIAGSILGSVIGGVVGAPAGPLGIGAGMAAGSALGGGAGSLLNLGGDSMHNADVAAFEKEQLELMAEDEDELEHQAAIMQLLSQYL